MFTWITRSQKAEMHFIEGNNIGREVFKWNGNGHVSLCVTTHSPTSTAELFARIIFHCLISCLAGEAKTMPCARG